MENTLYIDLKGKKRVIIELMPEKAPNHVKQIKKLVRDGFYNGIVFHRVIDGFMAQTGDPTGTGTGGSNEPDLKAEFSSVPFERGIVGMARKPDLDSANSQFFICFEESSFLNGQYTVIGKVVEGMEYVDQIKKNTTSNGNVINPDKMERVRIAADVRE
ncbi:MAG: peptidylprolyl isomerase [Alphaproteobacteria bacterium]|nr:peptidylprolyl isomerase [Alphaproteobacteria bacterium]